MAESTKLYQVPGEICANCPENTTCKWEGSPGRMVPYDKYRRETGLCETCDQLMNLHKKCETCHILIGSGHWIGFLELFRGHELCGPCISSWQTLEKVQWKTEKAIFDAGEGEAPPPEKPRLIKFTEFCLGKKERAEE